MTIEQGTLPGMKPSEIQRLQLETLCQAPFKMNTLS